MIDFARNYSTPLRLSFLTAPLLTAVMLCGKPAEHGRFLSPEEALGKFQIEPGLRIELVAAEPLVVDPVAFAFDEQRRLYVVENRGYPDPGPGKPTTYEGRVARLEDTDGDGRYDRRTEFAAGLSYPNGIVVWKGGVFVTCAPDIIYLKDRDGDGVADERRTVLTGFDTTRTTQIRVSSPTLGLDGKIYVACGLTGGNVRSPEHPERASVSFSPMDGCFDPDTFIYTTTGGRGQFGLAFDAYGRRFVSSNRHPVLQTVLSPGYLQRNPHLAFSDTDQTVSKVTSEARVFPVSRANVTADFIPDLMGKPHSGTFTSACGLTVFDGSGLRDEHVGNVFICEPAQNLVQRQKLRLEGASFRSDLVYEGREFLASTDTWFRPVFLANGPDGALYLADMYRREIDHPEYVPKDARDNFDFVSGKNLGRIYRIVRDDAAPGAPVSTSPAKSSVATLCQDLESADSWTRETAQRLLVERADSSAVSLLEKIAAHAASPRARTRALWTLRGLHALSERSILTALNDRDGEVREQGVVLAGERQPASPELTQALLAKADDDHPRVRFQTALVLGSSTDAKAVTALANIASRDGQDRWARAAVLSGIHSRLFEFFDALSRAPHPSPQAYAAVMEDMSRVIGAGASLEDCRAYLRRILADGGPLSWRLPAVLGLGDGLLSRKNLKVQSETNPFLALIQSDTKTGTHTELDAFFSQVSALLQNEHSTTAERIRAVALLGYTDFDQAGTVLGNLLDARYPPELQLQAVRALERIGDPRAGELLIQPAKWAHYTPQIREAVISTLTSKPKMIRVLFAAIDQKVIKPAEIAPVQRNRLLKHKDPAIQAGATTAFHELQGGDRMTVYQEYRAVLSLDADPTRGAAVFERSCSACHAFGGVGGHVGPDLSGIRNQPADALLLHILVPNYEVVPGYQAVTITTRDNRSITGRITTETDNSLSLSTMFGTDETILRSGIASLVASSLSLMPDGLEQTMTKNDLADLIAYLKSVPKS